MKSILSAMKREDGAATVEFVAVSFALLMLIFFVVELTLLFFFSLSAQKAAQMGVRLAIVSDPVVVGLPATNTRTGSGVFGASCHDSPSPCVSFGTLTCVGGGAGCDVDAFNRVLTGVKRFLGDAQAEDIEVSYSYVGLGFAGGPVVPSVTVTISGVDYQTGILGAIVGTRGSLSFLPAVSATLTGEDLNQGGA